MSAVEGELYVNVVAGFGSLVPDLAKPYVVNDKADEGSTAGIAREVKYIFVDPIAEYKL